VFGVLALGPPGDHRLHHVGQRLGHSTAKLTLDTYGHLMGTDAERAAIERVNRAFGGASGATEVEDSSRILRPQPKTGR
jgi:hypothetical protein